MNKNLVLIADDDDDDRECISQAFKSLGLAVLLDEVENGLKLIRYLEKAAVKHALPSLILLDINMPFMNGLECLRAINNEPAFKKIPVIIFSTSTDEKDKQEAKKLGVVDFYEKPSSMAGFKVVASSVLSHIGIAV